MRILDLGSGTGDFLSLLKPSYGLGIDSNPAVVEAARGKYPELDWQVSDIKALDLKGETFDYILLVNTIGFLDDVQAVFRNIRRFATPDTRLVIIHYNYLWEPILKSAEYLGMKMPEPYLNWLSIGDMENLLYVEGFETLKKKQSVLFPKHIPLVSAFLNAFVVNLPFVWRLGLVESVVARPLFVEESSSIPSCSVIIPAKNEKGNIEEAVRRIPDMGGSTEIVFVEGHSEDGTRNEIERVSKAYPDRNIKLFIQDGDGKGDAVRKGFDNSEGDVLMILDADLTVRPEDLPRFYECVTSGRAELAMGCRLVYQLEDESMRFLNLLGNKFFSMAFSYLLGQRIKDTLCGTKALRRRHYRLIAENRGYFGDFDPFGDFDLIFGAVKANLRLVEIPVRYHARTYGETQIRRFRHGWLLLKMVVTAVRKLKFVC